MLWKSVALAFTLPFLLAASIVAAAPAQAANAELGKGRALVYLAAKHAMVTPSAGDTSVLLLPRSSNGKFLGMRKDSSGVKRAVVGSITAKKLISHWEKLKYANKGVVATLAWNGFDDAVQVRIAKPRVTSAGIVVKMAGAQSVPRHLMNASLNLLQAAKGSTRAYPVAMPVNIIENLNMTVTANSNSATTATIWDSTNGNTSCYTGNMSTTTLSVSIPTGVCDSITYSSGFAKSYWANATYGVNGYVKVSMNITPPNTSMYSFIHTFGYWTQSGSPATYVE